MLMQSIRDHATGWIAWVIVILISIPFALWGIQEYVSPTSNVAVATINGVDVGVNEFQRSYQRQRAQLQSLLGASFDINQLDDERLREEALNQLVNDEVVLQAAIAGGMRVGDRQLAHAIQAQAIFQRDGVFSEELYQQWLRTQGYSAGGFENDLKRSMLAEQLVAGVATSAFVTERELENALRLQRQKRVFETLTVPVSRFDDVEVDAQAVLAHYEANQASYVAPEQVKLKVVEVSRDAIAADVDVTEQDLRAIYERRKRDLQTQEQREASHILLTLDDDADEAALAAARERLLDLKRQIEGGAAFETLAAEHSQDPGSARQGGSLGPIGRGVMDPSFEDAVFALALDEVSDPVRSAFGLHLIKLDAIHASKLPTFDEVHEQLRRDYQNEQSEQQFVEMVEILANLAFENPDSLDALADDLGVTPSITDWISPIAATNSGIGRNAAVIEAAFSPDVLQEGFNSAPIELDPTRVIVIRVAEHQASRQQPLEEVRERIERELGARQARKLAADSARVLLERLQSGEDRGAVAEQAELTWSESTELARDARQIDASVLETVFRMGRPGAGEALFGTATSAGGDTVIVALERVVDGSVDGEDAQQVEAVKRALEVDAGRATYDAVVQTLRNDADVVLIRENL